MGWFDEQIRQRKKSDNDMFAASFLRVAQAVTGRKESSDADGQAQMKNAMDEILKYYHVQGREIPDNIKDGEERLEYLLRPTGMMRRRVTLEKGWFRDAYGAMLGVRKEDGSAVALIPSGFGGYTFYDSASGKRVKVDSRNEAIFDDEALAFYRPFPLKKMGARDMVVYIFQSLSMRDLAWFAVGEPCGRSPGNGDYGAQQGNDFGYYRRGKYEAADRHDCISYLRDAEYADSELCKNPAHGDDHHKDWHGRPGCHGDAGFLSAC